MCAISTFGVDSPWLCICDVMLLSHSLCSSMLNGCNCSAKNVRTSLEIANGEYILTKENTMELLIEIRILTHTIV